MNLTLHQYLYPAIQLAGLLHLLVATANLFLPRILHYRENLAKVEPIIREIFLVHALYIILILVGIGLLCLVFTNILCEGSLLGRCISGFLAIFWALRVALQIGFYDRTVKKAHPWGNLFFTGVFLYFACIFVVATLD